MGIQGLLPLLKPIQRHRHLSEFAGQTIAVDAYVWLHRGAYACATELAQGRPTRRYIDFCMSRVRILRHHGIEPFLVFDGGPLPAKLGTEKERKKKREENMKRAKEYLSQGKTGLATECYAKCLDVTPQMAYQVIKALKVENVRYVVAPYEADAQLAYLERTGLVDGIITEDSDLLVFGCHNVHVKLDAVSATVVSICRTDFGSPSLAAGSFSLVGWSKAQFRWMAMLSGCDYLPSISGVGLKTAYQMLRKYKTVDKAVKMIRLEGKKPVPKDYINSFYLAEKVFLHQRVYDPLRKKLVYLTDPPSCLSEADEMYIGRDLDPSLAVRIACGDVCPISLDDMEDINPSFNPKHARKRPLRDHDTNRLETPKRTGPDKKGSILSFLAPVAKPLSEKAQPSPQKKEAKQHLVAGNASGKRTLTDVMEHDIATKRKKVTADNKVGQHKTLSTSHFFNRSERSSANSIKDSSEKENFFPGPMRKAPELVDPVSQEDGYISPSPSLSRAGTPDVSSPNTPCIKLVEHACEAQDVCSHVSRVMPPRTSVERVFVRGSSEPVPDCSVIPGPDLAETFAEDEDDDSRSEATSEILCWEADDADDLQKEAFGASRDLCEAPLPGVDPGKIESSVQSGILRVASSDDPTEELELLEIDEMDMQEKERDVVHARLAEKWRLSYTHKDQHRNSGLGGSSANNRSLNESQKSETRRGHGREAAATALLAVNVEIERRGSTQATGHSRDSRPHSSRQNPRIDSRKGSRGEPILIDADNSSSHVGGKSRERLQTFRFRA